MYLKRKADAYLNAWKSDPNRAYDEGQAPMLNNPER